MAASGLLPSVTRQSGAVVALVRHERRVFAAKLRTARALLNWSQSELAGHVGLTQRAIHMLEQGETEPRRATVLAVEEVLRAQGLIFEEHAGGFQLIANGDVLERAAQPRRQKRRVDFTVVKPASPAAS